MGGLGRDFNGSYAEYVVVPLSQIQILHSHLPWETLGAMPGMLQTAYGSPHKGLSMKAGEILLIRGGTTSIGLAAAELARNAGVTVLSSTRNSQRETLLRERGAEEVFIDDGSIAQDLRETYPAGVDKVLELIGVSTLIDSMACTKVGGICCMTGIVGNEWSFESLILWSMFRVGFV